MRCFKPITLKDESVVPCGKCVGCLNSKRQEWVHRLMQEDKDAEQSTFLTLTYNDENLPLLENEHGILPSLFPYDLTNYWKRVRKANEKKIKYYAVGEYGTETDRPHYHAIVFDADEEVLERAWTKNGKEMGFVTCDQVEEASIRYVTKYVIDKHNPKHFGREQPFSRVSNGIGMGYIKRTKAYHRQRGELHVTNPGGIIQVMPRYYQNKIWDEEELKEVRANREIPDDERDAATIRDQNKYYEIITKRKSKSINC